MTVRHWRDRKTFIYSILVWMSVLVAVGRDFYYCDALLLLGAAIYHPPTGSFDSQLYKTINARQKIMIWVANKLYCCIRMVLRSLHTNISDASPASGWFYVTHWRTFLCSPTSATSRAKLFIIFAFNWMYIVKCFIILSIL